MCLNVFICAKKGLEIQGLLHASMWGDWTKEDPLAQNYSYENSALNDRIYLKKTEKSDCQDLYPIIQGA